MPSAAAAAAPRSLRSSSSSPCSSTCLSPLLEGAATGLAVAHAGAVLEPLAPHAAGLAAVGADDLEVVDADRGLLLEDAPLDLPLRVGPRVALDEVDPLDDGPARRGQHAQDAPLGAAVLAGGHPHAVVLLDLELGGLALGRRRHTHLVSHRSVPLTGLLLQDFRRQRDDLHEAPLAQLAGDRTEDAGADRLLGLVDDHRGVGVEADVAAVGPPLRPHGAHDYRLDDLPFLD